MNRMSRTSAAAVLALTLVLGIFLGVGADRWYVDRNFHALARARFVKELEGPNLGRFLKPPPPPGEKGKRGRLIKDKLIMELTRQLKLNQLQVKKIDAILEAQRQEVDKNRERFFSELRNTITRTYGEIMKHLDENQKNSFRKYIDDSEAHGKREGR